MTSRVWTPGLAGISDSGPNSGSHGINRSFPETHERARVTVACNKQWQINLPGYLWVSEGEQEGIRLEDRKSDRWSQLTTCHFCLFSPSKCTNNSRNSYTSKKITFFFRLPLNVGSCTSIDDFNPQIFTRDQLDIVRTHDSDWRKINFQSLK